MSVRRIVLCAVVPLVLAVALAGLWTVRRPNVSASLYDLIGAEAERIPKFLREAASAEASVVVSSPDAEKAERAAASIRELPGAGAADFPPGAVDFVRENRGGLVTREMAKDLATVEGRARLSKRALRRVYMSPVSPILGFADDPFGLTDAFLLSLSGGASGGRLATNGVTRILIKFRIDAETAGNLDSVIAWYSSWSAAVKGRARDVEVRFAGAPVHAALSAAKSKREIGVLTWFSLAFIAALALVIFRSWQWIPLLASSLAVSALAGGLALVAAFHDLHVMTFVMGTTVLGLVIDYSFHWLLSSAEEKPSVCRNLLVSFLTTEISLVPLMLASIPVLRQSAVFLGVGLAAALGYVLLCYPKESKAVPPLPVSLANRQIFKLTGVVLLACVLLGLCRAQVRTEITSLYRPPAELVEAERQRASFGTFDFSSIPPLSERQAIAADVRKLYEEHGAELSKTLHLDALVLPPEPTDGFVEPKALMSGVFDAWTSDALLRLAIAVAFLLITLMIVFRRRALCVFLPSLAAIFAVAGVLGWTHTPINIFHVLAAFLLLGMGIDYAVFLQNGVASAMRPALSSLLTSMAGFGALVFVSFPVVASFGAVLGLGLPIAFLAALATMPRTDARERVLVRTEVAATPLGLEVLWWFYRLLGLKVLHLGAAAVGLCVWTFSRGVRRASPSLKKVIHFTRSLADKLVVMAEGKRLPRVTTDGSADAAAFLADVKVGRGIFVLSSHCGTVEALVALGECNATFHAWMDFDRTSVFNRFYLRHARRRRVLIHPISEIGMETAFFAGDALERGDSLVMAGDRGRGAFRFAHALGAPVYFVACVWTGGGYRAIIRRLPDATAEMEKAYAATLESVRSEFPDQWFEWEK